LRLLRRSCVEHQLGSHPGWVQLLSMIASIVEFLPYSAENPELEPVILARERL
jgi:hypothetical protein